MKARLRLVSIKEKTPEPDAWERRRRALLAVVLIVAVLAVIVATLGALSGCRDQTKLSETPTEPCSMPVPDASESPDAGFLDATECPQTFCPACPVEPDAGREPPPSRVGRAIPGLLLDDKGAPHCWFDVTWDQDALDALDEDCLPPGWLPVLYGFDKTWDPDLLPCPGDDSWCTSR